jgi:hypothetical protein
MMGIRMYQERGLTPAAIEFLEKNVVEKPGMICEKCGHIMTKTWDCRVYKNVDSFYGDGPHLQEYTLKDGRKAREVVQTEPWSSGPVAFFCLEIGGEELFSWTDEEIDEALGVRAS